MAVTYITKQNASAATEQTLYTVPTVVVSKIVSIFVTNRSATDTTFTIAHNVGGGATANTDYLYKDTPLPGNGVFLVTTPIFANTADKIKVTSGSSNVTFSLYAQETT